VTRFERKIVAILVVTGIIPLVATIWLFDIAMTDLFRATVNPDVIGRLDRSTRYHLALLESWKREMDLRADSVAASLARGATADEVRRHLDEPLEVQRPLLAHVRVEDGSGAVALDAQAANAPGPPDHRLRDVRRPLGDGRTVVATFALPQEVLDEHREAGEIAQSFRDLGGTVGDRVRRSFYLTFLVLLLGVLGGAFVLGLTLSRRVTRRIAILHRATEAVGAGDLTVRVPVGPDDEIGELTGAFNRMVEEVGDSRAKIAYLSKISVWQDVARRLAHEIKNPLQPIQLAMQELHRRYPRSGGDPEFRKLLDSTIEIVSEELGTLRRLTTEFSTFARLPEVKLAPDDLHDLLRDMQGSPTAPPVEDEAPVRVEWRIPPDSCLVPMDRMLLRRVFDNLIRNAVEAVRATRRDGTGRVVVSADGDPRRRRVRVRVSDNGPGVPSEGRDRLFEPYYTTKAEGTGLGLAIVKKVVLDHGGTIDVGTSSEGGAEFVVTLPTRTASLAAPPRPA